MISQKYDDNEVLERIRRFNASLDRLMRLYTGDTVSSAEFARVVTQETSVQLKAARVSAWSLRAASYGIDLIDLYLAAEDEHQTGISLYVHDFPRYFEAVLSERVIVANDARTDPRTLEFTEPYLKPNRIVSMLDAQIRSAAGPRGVVCVETVDARRAWSPDEIAFVVSVAELLGFSMDREDRCLVHAQLEDTNERLAEAVATAREAHERYDLAIQAAYDGVWDYDLINDKIYLSEQNFELLGETFDNTISSLDWWKVRIHPDDAESIIEAFENHLNRDAPYNVTYRVRHRDGSWRWWRSRGKVVRNANDEPTRIVGTNSDVTSLVETQSELEERNQQLVVAKQEIEDRALHDSLTGLPNRRHMDRVCDDILLRARGKGHVVSILHIDLDFFKEVNDKFGHAAGDETLRRVANILTSLCKPGDFVARIGGDEFVAMLSDTSEAQRSVVFSKQLIMLLDKPILVGDDAFSIGISIGIALSDDRCIDVWRLLGNADLALYKAKKRGRNRYEIFNETMRIQAAFIRDTKEDIQRSLANGIDFIPFFQPQFYAGSLELAGAEALARWKHPTRGLLSPEDFLDLAKEMNCASALDHQVLLKSIAIVSRWRERGLYLPRLSVNVSNERLNDPNLLDCVEELGGQVKSLTFELLESTFLDDTSEQVSEILQRLRQLGVEIEIDDFGSGYASILSLINIRPKRLKIDGTLTANVDKDEAMTSLIQSIVDIARALDIEVVAEGVETYGQIMALTEIGCDILQGFGLAPPMSEDRFYLNFAAMQQERGLVHRSKQTDQVVLEKLAQNQ